MSSRVVRECADHLETVSLIEQRGLEGVRFERELSTTAMPSLGFGRTQEPTANTSPSHVLAHPQRVDPARTTPTPAVYPANQLAVTVGLDPQELMDLAYPSGIEIELDDLVAQPSNNRTFGLSQRTASPVIRHPTGIIPTYARREHLEREHLEKRRYRASFRRRSSQPSSLRSCDRDHSGL